MSTPLSSHAQRALESLNESWMVNMFIRQDALRNDERCSNLNKLNSQYNSSLDYYLGSLQVCHSADVLNSYCQSILGEILKIDDAAWTAFDSTVKEKHKKSRDVMIEKLLSHKATDRIVRAHLRDIIQCYWPLESEIVTLLRNKFVHQGGLDSKREVEQMITIKSLPWCVICLDVKPNFVPVRYYDADQLDADAELGSWACAHTRTHIHAMDQNLCHRFQLKRDRWRPRPISRRIGTLPILSKPIQRESVGDGNNLKNEIVSNKSKPTIMSIQESTITQKEIDCARAWQIIQNDISSFIKQYLIESGVDLRAMYGGIVGNPLPHTIKNQERCLEYDLAPEMDADEFKVERINIRLRESDFVPYVTVWSRRASMKDFITPILSPELENYIRDVIDKIITH